ncbi:hypothetical protein ACLB2K_050591 [Fragaria x ananassa]
MAGTMSSRASNTISEIEISLKPKSDDVGWEYGSLVNLSNLDKVKCKLCGKILSGGIYQLKQHIAHEKGNVTLCNKSSDEDKNKCKSSSPRLVPVKAVEALGYGSQPAYRLTPFRPLAGLNTRAWFHKLTSCKLLIQALNPLQVKKLVSSCPSSSSTASSYTDAKFAFLPGRPLRSNSARLVAAVTTSSSLPSRGFDLTMAMQASSVLDIGLT